MGYRTMSLKTTTVACLEAGYYLGSYTDNADGAKALHRAGLYLLALQGIEPDSDIPARRLSENDVVRELQKLKLDNGLEEIANNALRFITGNYLENGGCDA